MQIRESQWIGRQLDMLTSEELFPLLNVGSSTLDFRSRVQPHIDQNIFEPLRRRGGKVIHLDIKPEGGVDLVGDLLDPAFREKLRALGVRSAMVSNLLEHVTDRHAICRAVLDALPAGGCLIVSGPFKYPYHADPIDTLFRPTIEEICAYFPGTDLIASAYIDSGNWRQWHPSERGGRTLTRAVARLLLPFYRPAKWWELARQTPYLVRHVKAFAVVLRKSGAHAPRASSERHGAGAMPPTNADIGAVVIGRNEGQRLVQCVESVRRQVGRVVYVDSGSTDGSPKRAAQLGADVIRLDPVLPFTAARGRDEGAKQLSLMTPPPRYVLFIDGDCELADGFVDQARLRLDEDATLAGVCGRRRERHPHASVFNRLMDIEWSARRPPSGSWAPIQTLGGDALMRLDAYHDAGGFDPAIVAREEPDLSVRLRERGWRLEVGAVEMTWHDAAMTSAIQWWRRNRRNGIGYGQVALKHRRSAGRFASRDVARMIFWGIALPLTFAAASVAALFNGHDRRWQPAALVLSIGAAVVGGQVWRLFRHARYGSLTRGDTPVGTGPARLSQPPTTPTSDKTRSRDTSRLGRRDALLYAVFTLAANTPMALGAVSALVEQSGRRRVGNVDYKTPQPARVEPLPSAGAEHGSANGSATGRPTLTEAGA